MRELSADSGRERNGFVTQEFHFENRVIEKVECNSDRTECEWIVEQAGRSGILHGKKIIYIANTLDTALFFPVSDREKLRRKYGIVQNKKVILFGAADNGTENENKGFRFLRQAFQYLEADKYILLIFGNTARNMDLPEELEVIRAGYVTEEDKMNELYNAADVLVNPSSQESFGYTVCEAMACGTPAVGFPIGGIKEQIVHKENGYLARYHDPEDLAEGIKYCIEYRDDLGVKAYQATQRYSYKYIGGRYKEVIMRRAGYEDKRKNKRHDCKRI